MLFLVRHGRPLIDRPRPAHEWELDPAAYDDIWALRTSGRLPEDAVWFSSPEPKALGTAGLLFDGEVGVIDDLRELVRTEWVDDLGPVMRRCFAEPELSPHPGWESLKACQDRVVRAVDSILAAHQDTDVVLVGHGTAWTALAAVLTGTQPDLDKWHALQMPDLITVEDLRSK
jgi:broad specificity phosphatase PhoE